MKITYFDDKITILLNPYVFSFSSDITDEKIKEIILKIRNKISDLNGFYKVYAYYNDKFGLIIDMKKEDELDIFPELLDLKITLFKNSNFYLKFDDFFLIEKYPNKYYYNNNYYLKCSNVKYDDILKLSEFYEVIYGITALKLENKLIKI